MSEARQDPFEDPQLAEGWAAFSQLLAAAETPLDEARLVSNIASRLERRARRRRLRFVGGALAMAASVLVIVGGVAWIQHGGQTAPVVAKGDASNIDPMIAVLAGEAAPSATDMVPWVDELAEQTASLSEEARATEERWQQPPDSIALLQSEVDRFEQEMATSAL
jgi:hypothetical protein